MKMLAHPVTGHIVLENDYAMILDWHRIKFIKLDNCKLMEADGEVKKVAICEGEPFESVLTHEDYFEEILHLSDTLIEYSVEFW